MKKTMDKRWDYGKAIIVTFILYQFIILPYCLKYGSMHQLFSSTDIAVHYLSPFLVVMDMILFDKNQDYSFWYIPFQWLLIPIIYFFYIVGRTFFHRPVPEPGASLSLFLFRYYRYWDSKFYPQHYWDYAHLLSSRILRFNNKSNKSSPSLR